MAFVKTWWPAILLAVILIAIYAYGQWQRHDERKEIKKDVKIEKLETDVKNKEQDAKTRKLQNEAINRDISPTGFDGVLENNNF